MKKVLWLIVCLMAMVIGVSAHNVHYPTYTENGITYVKTSGRVSISGLGTFDIWNVQKVDKPYDRTITIPYELTINGKEVRVQGINENAFETCVSLDSLIISNGVFISTYSMVGCRDLDYLYYNFLGCGSGTNYKIRGLSCKTLETLYGVNLRGFWEAMSNSLEKLIIGENTNNVYNRMDWCKKLKTIICFSTTPPNTKGAEEGGCWVSFESWQWPTVTLYVPRESLEKYYFDKVWGEIDNIYTIDEMDNETTSINSINNSTNLNNVWYSLDGVRVDKPTKGVYIKNGKKYILTS